MYTPTQSSFGTFGRNEDKGEMTNGMYLSLFAMEPTFDVLIVKTATRRVQYFFENTKN